VPKRLWMTCLAVLALCGEAQASFISFFDQQFDATAIAITVDGVPGVDTQSSPPLATPVSASADSTGTTDFATAGAIAGPGVLTASADVTAGGGIANAVATSHFAGSFINAAFVYLSIDFTALDFAVDAGSASSSLFVSVVSDGVTLFADFISGLWEFEYRAPLGSVSTLDLTLTSEANAGLPGGGVGGASTFGLATLAGRTLPLPAAWLLVLLGLGAVVVVTKRSSNAPALCRF
jgi:hypothetical protein